MNSIIPVASTNVYNNFLISIVAKLDSGATKHSFKLQHLHTLNDIHEVSHGPTALLPNNTKVQASHKGQCSLHKNVSPSVQTTLVFPKLSNESSLSMG